MPRNLNPAPTHLHPLTHPTHAWPTHWQGERGEFTAYGLLHAAAAGVGVLTHEMKETLSDPGGRLVLAFLLRYFMALTIAVLFHAIPRLAQLACSGPAPPSAHVPSCLRPPLLTKWQLHSSPSTPNLPGFHPHSTP